MCCWWWCQERLDYPAEIEHFFGDGDGDDDDDDDDDAA